MGSRGGCEQGRAAGRAGTRAQPETRLVGKQATPACPPQLPAFLPQVMGCVLGQGWRGILPAISAEAGAEKKKHAGIQRAGQPCPRVGRQAGDGQAGLSIPLGTRSLPSPPFPVLLLPLPTTLQPSAFLAGHWDLQPATSHGTAGVSRCRAQEEDELHGFGTKPGCVKGAWEKGASNEPPHAKLQGLAWSRHTS